TTADLWSALEGASGKPITPIAAAYTEQAGVPLIISTARCEGNRQQLLLRQERFTINYPDASAEHWQEPIALNLGDLGYYRVEYDVSSENALANRFAAMAPDDRVNLLADNWALAES